MKNCFFPNVSPSDRKLPYFLHCSARQYDQEEVQRPDGCHWFQLNICMSGKGILKMGGREQEINEGDSMIIFPDISHHYYAVGGPMIVSWIAFDGFQVASLLKSIGIETSGLYRLGNNKEIHEAIGKTLTLQNCEMTEQGILGSEKVYSFLLTLVKGYDPEHDAMKTGENLKKIKPALEFMNRHLSEPIGIEDMADSMGISPQHFCLLFKSALNQRPFEYLNSLRLNHSKNLLIDEPDLPLKEVSGRSGYANHSYFCQLFKKQERLTPAEFRKLYKQDNLI
ncbi:AraC family transcriptional regulator [Spirochaeta isovalerica]|uniref:AraC-like DNA-binding protein n=1 Tax=Spirochaeta isovalerica TaxID=150 RepID=A0A841RBH9_9SPIO|nr:AraC family transcriptional regulator [Spirochaeta isovalerica]MBB6480597.1 AraC-like DNA-binding protein [Spirochaeta isovalerica]